jgi:hypothetical protein
VYYHLHQIVFYQGGHASLLHSQRAPDTLHCPFDQLIFRWRRQAGIHVRAMDRDQAMLQRCYRKIVREVCKILRGRSWCGWYRAAMLLEVSNIRVIRARSRVRLRGS